MRNDLLALTPDDLALLTNRGLARRAQQEIEGGALGFELEEDAAGTVTVRWSDEAVCVLPHGKPVSAGRCSCPATTICRHLLRSVLAYQQHAAAREEAAPPQPVAPWDPGAIPDAELTRAVSRAALAWARQAFGDGQVAELVRGVKPSAVLHTLACTVRFLVPGDVRYTHCDCAEPAPCRHAPLAVWAFRALDPERGSGIVETAAQAAPVPAALLDDLDGALRELAALGMRGAPAPLVERLRRLERRCRDAGLAWPADVLADLALAHAAYASHDARFDPHALARLVGELCLRADAIRANTGAVPQLFVRGAPSDRETAMSTARLVGLGCGVRPHRGGVELAAYMQDAASGALVVVRRDEPDASDGSASPLWQLAQRPVAKGVSLAALGAGQALAKGGRRLPNGQFVPGRAALALSPQSYAWETLRPPVLAEDFAELTARLVAQPPAALRPRRLPDGLYVCAVAGVEGATFATAEQAVHALLRDANGDRALLAHPYTTRGQSGVAALLALLQSQGEAVRFVAGHMRLSARGLVVAPTALVVQEGATRRALLPSVAHDEQHGADVQTTLSVGGIQQSDPLATYWAEAGAALGDLLVEGLQHADERTAARWRELARHGAALGFARAIGPAERLAAALEARAHTLRWDAQLAAAFALEVACMALLADDALHT